MTWSYSGNPTTSPIDEVRFLIQDTDETIKLLENEEIQYLIDTWESYGSPVYVAAVAADIIASKFAGVVNISADGVSINTADLSGRYRELAISMRNLYKAGAIGVIDIANLMYDSELDPSIKPLLFGIGMNDNIYAGQQNYGGQIDPWRQAEDRMAGGG